MDVGGIWTRHAEYGWQIQVRTVELLDHLDRRGVVAFLVAYTTHLGPVRAAAAVERFGRWDADAGLVQAVRDYLPQFGSSEDARVEAGPSGDPAADDARVYSRELYEAECLAAERLGDLLRQDAPLYGPDELNDAIKQAESQYELMLEADQRRAIASALSKQVSAANTARGQIPWSAG